MKLGINTYTFMWSIGIKGANPAYPNMEALPKEPFTLFSLLDKARDLGVHLVQTGPNLPLDQLSEPNQDAFTKKALNSAIELELGTRGLEFDHLTKQITLAKRIGARLIRTVPEINGQVITDSKLIPPVLQNVVPILEKEGIQLAMENGRIPAVELRAALDQIKTPFVGVVLDMVNSLAVAEGWKEVTRLLAPYTMCVHYKDFTIKRAWHMMGFICEGTPAGKGMVETQWLFDTLKTSPYDFNVILELWTPEQKSVDASAELEKRWAVESVRYLRQFIRE